MHDAGAILALQLAQMGVAAMGDKRIGEGIIDMAGARVAYEADLLGEHDEVVVLEADIERDVVVGREQASRLGDVGQHSLDAIAKQDLLALGCGERGVNGDGALLDELGACGARRRSVEGCEVRVEPHAIGIGAHQGLEQPSISHMHLPSRFGTGSIVPRKQSESPPDQTVTRSFVSLRLQVEEDVIVLNGDQPVGLVDHRDELAVEVDDRLVGGPGLMRSMVNDWATTWCPSSATAAGSISSSAARVRAGTDLVFSRT